MSAGFSSFPISRDPPEGGTCEFLRDIVRILARFQFLGIPPKGEPGTVENGKLIVEVSNF